MVFLTSALYYLVAEWLLEKEQFLDYQKLEWAADSSWIFRLLKKAKLTFSSFEFWVRAVAGVLFGLVVILPPIFPSSHELHSRFFYLALVYFYFLIWDLAIVDGGGEAGRTLLKKTVIFTDTSGALLCLFALWLHDYIPGLSTLLIVILGCVNLVALSVVVRDHGYLVMLRDRKLQR